MSSDVAVRDAILNTQYNALRDEMLCMTLFPSGEKTLSGDTFTLSANQTFVRLDTEGDDSSDNLVTINGGAEGIILVLIQENSARNILLKHGTGNLLLAGSVDANLHSGLGSITLLKDPNGKWRECFRGAGPAGSAIPSGGVALFDADCPSGWTRFSALDGKYPQGASSYGTPGGSGSHTHTYSAITSHTHGAGSLLCAADGAHSHYIEIWSSGSGNKRSIAYSLLTAHAFATNSAGSHTHTLSGATASTGSASGTTESTSCLPPSLDMILCKKD